MDAQRFDDLTRLIGSGASRRRVLALLGGGLATLLTGLRSGRAQCANPETCVATDECCPGFACDPRTSSCVEAVLCVVDGEICADHAECCSGNCVNDLCAACRPEGAICTDNAQCCSGDCFEGICIVCRGHGQPCQGMFDCCTADCYNGVCVPCREVGAPCSFEWHCCNSVCVHDTVCVDCALGGAPCSDPSECCSGDCSEGACAPLCLPRGRPCTDSSQCCPGNVCGAHGSCHPPCSAFGEACLGDADCCGGGVCSRGTCVEPCVAEGESPCYGSGAYPCCEGLECVDDTCIAGSECVAEGGACVANNDCCGGICCAGACLQTECCANDADPDTRCPGGTTCIEGVCQVADDTGGTPDDGDPDKPPDEEVTQLPDTGVGTGDTGQRALPGLASLVAGAAALLAGRKIRDDRDTADKVSDAS